MTEAVLTKWESHRAEFPVFLTAFDPSDLPGGSLDPLGFERGYLFLADKILPGLTNVADRPRYFSVLCAGASLAEVDTADSPRTQYQRRLDCIQRFERFWALANVLASEEAGDDPWPVSGIRGVTYASDRAGALLRTGARRTDANFKMLSRQVPYGVVGIYGAVAEGMRLIDRKTLTLTPDLGERLAEGFLSETDAPAALVKAVREDGDVSLARLIDWGRRAHVSGDALPVERVCTTEMLHRDPIRSRMATALAAEPFRGTDDREQDRLSRLLPRFAREPSNQDLREAVTAILAYEGCFQLATLCFERLLWRCRQTPAAAVHAADLNSDSALQAVCEGLPAASNKFGESLDTAQSEQFRTDLQRLEDARRFLEVASAACRSPESLAHEIVSRHADVQRGKFDRGRRKMPWLEVTAGRISLTMTRVGGLSKEVAESADIAPHPYRLHSADALISAAGGV